MATDRQSLQTHVFTRSMISVFRSEVHDLQSDITLLEPGPSAARDDHGPDRKPSFGSEEKAVPPKSDFLVDS